MGTRGFISFVADGQTKTGYNQFDAYPGGFGMDVLVWLRAVDPEAAKVRAQALRVVDDSAPPTDADIEQLKSYFDPRVGRQGEPPSWYQLLRGTQGDPAAILDAGAIEDASGFPADSLFAEWGYVIDFDAMAFEVYEGFQKAKHSDGRFADMPPVRDREYFPVRLAKSWPLSDLPDNAAFMALEDGGE